MRKREWWPALVVGFVMVALFSWGFSRSDLKVPKPIEFADSAGVVADSSVGTRQLNPSEPLDFVGPSVRIFSDSLTLSSVWCGFHTWYEDASSGDGMDTNFVACPIVGDSTNTAIFRAPFHSWFGALASGAPWNYWANMHSWVCKIDPASGFWVRCRNYDASLYVVQGEFWVVFRFSPP